MGSLFHEHDDGFRGVHTHELGGKVVEHAHTGTDELPVVEVGADRYKRPKIDNPNAESVTLVVDDVTHDVSAVILAS